MSQIYEVKSPLDEVIRHYYYLRTGAHDSTITKRLVPNFEILMVFNFGTPLTVFFNDAEAERTTIDRIAVIGPLRKLMSYQLSGGTDAVAVVFTMNGFFRLFKTPVTELSGSDLHDPESMPKLNEMMDLWQQLTMSADAVDRIQILNDFLLNIISNNEPGFEVLVKSIPYFDNPAIQPVKALSSDSLLTERTVQQRFQKYLGFSPKEMLRYKRFKNLVNQLLNQDNNTIDLFELIVTHGYHDQSHLTKDFNHFMGTTPRKFIKEIVGKNYCMSKPGKNY